MTLTYLRTIFAIILLLNGFAKADEDEELMCVNFSGNTTDERHGLYRWEGRLFNGRPIFVHQNDSLKLLFAQMADWNSGESQWRFDGYEGDELGIMDTWITTNDALIATTFSEDFPWDATWGDGITVEKSMDCSRENLIMDEPCVKLYGSRNFEGTTYEFGPGNITISANTAGKASLISLEVRDGCIARIGDLIFGEGSWRVENATSDGPEDVMVVTKDEACVILYETIEEDMGLYSRRHSNGWKGDEMGPTAVYSPENMTVELDEMAGKVRAVQVNENCSIELFSNSTDFRWTNTLKLGAGYHRLRDYKTFETFEDDVLDWKRWENRPTAIRVHEGQLISTSPKALDFPREPENVNTEEQPCVRIYDGKKFTGRFLDLAPGTWSSDAFEKQSLGDDFRGIDVQSLEIKDGCHAHMYNLKTDNSMKVTYGEGAWDLEDYWNLVSSKSDPFNNIMEKIIITRDDKCVVTWPHNIEHGPEQDEFEFQMRDFERINVDKYCSLDIEIRLHQEEVRTRTSIPVSQDENIYSLSLKEGVHTLESLKEQIPDHIWSEMGKGGEYERQTATINAHRCHNVVCPVPENSCQAPTCNPKTGTCEYSDGYSCPPIDECHLGFCRAGNCTQEWDRDFCPNDHFDVSFFFLVISLVSVFIFTLVYVAKLRERKDIETEPKDGETETKDIENPSVFNHLGLTSVEGKLTVEEETN